MRKRISQLQFSKRCRDRGSNPVQSDYKANALPTELPTLCPRIVCEMIILNHIFIDHVEMFLQSGQVSTYDLSFTYKAT